ncbi:imm11 family protein [Roseibium sp.]|uniref:imm11 family protein n=1 Tax=Roseibium sp. TaxID=1936156 RepID=UPI003B529587
MAYCFDYRSRGTLDVHFDMEAFRNECAEVRALSPLPDFFQGEKIDPAIAPKRIIQTSKHKSWTCFNSPAGVMMVCQAFKDIVDQLEPDVHQFFPVEAVKKDGSPAVDSQFYFLNVRQRFEAILFDQSTLKWKTVQSGGRTLTLPYHSGGHQRIYTLSKPEVAGRHMWLSSYLVPSRIFFSDELTEAVRATKLDSVLRWHPAPEVDEPWIPEDNLKAEMLERYRVLGPLGGIWPKPAD